MLRIIAGEYRSRQLKSLESDATRPTTDKVKEAVFSRIGPYFENGSFLDLFAGSGAVGLEAISRGMDKAVFCENNPKAVRIIKENIRSLKAEEKCRIVQGSFQSYLTDCQEKFDYIYFDPPYDLEIYDSTLERIGEYLNEEGIVIVESRKERVLKDSYNGIIKIKDAVYGISKITYYRKES